MTFPLPVDAYPPPSSAGLVATLGNRVAFEPFNAVATGVFALAVVHTFAAAKFTERAHHVQRAHEARARAAGVAPTPHVWAELLHFFGEVEVVFGLWAVVLLAAASVYHGWDAATSYVDEGVNYREPLFVVVIMALASTRPVVLFAESALRRVASLGGGMPAAWWLSIVSVGPLLGSFITEPAAMTISALLLGRQFFDLQPSRALRYATLGLLFVNVSIGGTLTHFAAPPVLMVARPWAWDSSFMVLRFGWRAVIAILISTIGCFVVFRREWRTLNKHPPVRDVERPDEDAASAGGSLLPVPGWVIAVHIAFIAWTVLNAHHPALFLGGFLFFLGFVRATAAYQSFVALRAPLLVGFFLGGLVIHGGLQAWWIAPTLAALSEQTLFLGATVLTAFNDNALVTYLATLVPNLSESMKVAVVGGAVTGGGLTIIANAPNPAGQALLSRFFDGAVNPLGLFVAALPPTLIAAAILRL